MCLSVGIDRTFWNEELTFILFHSIEGPFGNDGRLGVERPDGVKRRTASKSEFSDFLQFLWQHDCFEQSVGIECHVVYLPDGGWNGQRVLQDALSESIIGYHFNAFGQVDMTDIGTGEGPFSEFPECRLAVPKAVTIRRRAN